MSINLLLSPYYVLMITLFDLLFLPRILPIFGIPASLLLVIAYIYKNGMSRVKFLMLITIATIGFVSVLNGIIVKDDVNYVEDIKRVLQLVTALLYATFFIRICERYLSSITMLLRLFIVWVFLWSIIFITAPDLYLTLNLLFFPEVEPSLEENMHALRFNYFFSDPNAAAYFLCFALCLYVVIEKNIFILVVSMLLSSVVILLTQSRGGYISLILIVIYVFIKDKGWSNKLILFFTLLLILPLIYLSFSDFFDSLIKLYEFRVASEDELGTGLGGGRIGKYDYFISNINILPFGVGYSLFQNGMEFRPHSDLIRINFSYGYVLFAALSYFIFPRVKGGWLIFIVFCIPFLINTVIDDYKLFPLYLIISNVLYSLGRNGKEGFR
jgi:hypothetical protein